MGKRAPWTDEEVAAIQAWQDDHRWHGLTCPDHSVRLLRPTRNGFVCREPGCRYRQDWVPTALTRPVDIPGVR